MGAGSAGGPSEAPKEERYLLVTVHRVSAARRFWRELYALICWGLQRAIYRYDGRYAPFSYGVLGHEGFSVFGRKNADEVELRFFGSMKGPLKGQWDGPRMSRMQLEMRQALEEVARRYGYDDVLYRERKPSPFYTA